MEIEVDFEKVIEKDSKKETHLDLMKERMKEIERVNSMVID